MHVEESESGAILSFGRRYSITIRVTVNSRQSLEEAWPEVLSRLTAWRARRGDRAHAITVFIRLLDDSLASCGKRLLAEHFLCQDEVVFAGINVVAFLIGSDDQFHCEIGIPSLL